MVQPIRVSQRFGHRNRSALEVSEAEFDRCFAVNVKSLYLATQYAVPVFRSQGGGSFINIASTAGLRPRPGLTWYNGSKAAVIGTSKSMAAELGPDNIRVNCINPVFNPDTGLSAEFAGGPVDDARRAKFLATIPLGRFSTALDVANATGVEVVQLNSTSPGYMEAPLRRIEFKLR